MDLPTISNTDSFTEGERRTIFGGKECGTDYLPCLVSELKVAVSLFVFCHNITFNVSAVFMGFLIYVCVCECVCTSVCERVY